MKTYTLFWLTGDKEIVQGMDIADAVRRSGYGGGAMAALDFWSEGIDEKENWIWNASTHKWEWSESKKRKLGLIK